MCVRPATLPTKTTLACCSLAPPRRRSGKRRRVKSNEESKLVFIIFSYLRVQKGDVTNGITYPSNEPLTRSWNILRRACECWFLQTNKEKKKKKEQEAGEIQRRNGDR